MGCSSSRNYVCVTPEKDIMVKIVDRVLVLDEKIRKGESLTRVEEREKKELNKVSKTMKVVQNYYNSNANPIA
jgi:hypothetical protein